MTDERVPEGGARLGEEVVKIMRWMWIAIALAAGCERKQEPPGPSCEELADHVDQVARKAYPGHGDMMPASSRKAYVAQCQQRKLTNKQRRCMKNAQSIEAMAECTPPQTPDGQKPGSPRGAPTPAPAAPAPPSAAPPPAAPAAAPAAPASTP